MRKVKEFQWISLFLAGLLFGSVPARADLADLIKAHSGTPSVVVSVPGHFGDDGYGIMTFPQEGALIAHLGLAKPERPEDPYRLENAVFKVVEDAEEQALEFKDFDGRNVLYHLMEARSYFMKLAEKTGVQSDVFGRKTTVRVRVTHKPAPFGESRFAKSKWSNQSAYLPFQSGGKEIWFMVRGTGHIRNFDLYSTVTSAIMAALSDGLDMFGLTTGIKLLRDYDSGMDTAKIPNVIYHEAFHWATDTQGLIPMPWIGHTTSEDYANYLGSSLYGKPKMADLGQYSSRFYKRNYSKIREIKEPRASVYNSTSLVSSVLWKIRSVIGAEKTDALVWSSLPLLRESVSEVDLKAALEGATRASPLLTDDEKAKVAGEIASHAQSFEMLDRMFGNTPLDAPAPPAGSVDLAQQASDADLAETARGQIDDLKRLPDEMKELGFEMSREEKAEIDRRVEELKAQSRKKSFGEIVLGVLKTIAGTTARGGLYAVQGVGFAAEGFQAAEGAPMALGTEFITKLILGRGRTTDIRSPEKPGPVQDVVGAAGGAVTFYYANAGIVTLSRGHNGRVSTTAMGVSLINQTLCNRTKAKILNPADPETRLQTYCKRLGSVADAIHRGAVRVGSGSAGWIRGLLLGKQSTPPAAPPEPSLVQSPIAEEVFKIGVGCFVPGNLEVLGHF